LVASSHNGISPTRQLESVNKKIAVINAKYLKLKKPKVSVHRITKTPIAFSYIEEIIGCFLFITICRPHRARDKSTNIAIHVYTRVSKLIAQNFPVSPKISNGLMVL
jgi:hypothetical protein